MTVPTELVTRLRALDPTAGDAGPGATAGPAPGSAARDAELLAIVSTEVRRPARRGLRYAARRHVGRAVALLLAVLVAGGGVAYAAGVPDDVRSVFGRMRSGFAPPPNGAPIAAEATLAAAFPLGDGRIVEHWSQEGLYDTCELTRVVGSADAEPPSDVGCTAGRPLTAASGTPTPGAPGVVLHPAVETFPVGSVDTTSDGEPTPAPRRLLVHVRQPGVTAVELRRPGMTDVRADLRAGWALLTVSDDSTVIPPGGSLDLIGSAGRVVSTFDPGAVGHPAGCLYDSLGREVC